MVLAFCTISWQAQASATFYKAPEGNKRQVCSGDGNCLHLVTQRTMSEPLQNTRLVAQPKGRRDSAASSAARYEALTHSHPAREYGPSRWQLQASVKKGKKLQGVDYQKYSHGLQFIPALAWKLIKKQKGSSKLFLSAASGSQEPSEPSILIKSRFPWKSKAMHFSCWRINELTINNI